MGKNPKENGYQSLHYSSRKRWRGTEWPFEVQIRSKKMHRIAEYGKAAHWSYKRKDIDGGEVTESPSIAQPRRTSSRPKNGVSSKMGYTPLKLCLGRNSTNPLGISKRSYDDNASGITMRPSPRILRLCLVPRSI